MRRLSTWLLIAIVLGGLFRLINLSGKVYWHDETYTALYATGHNNVEAVDLVFDGQLKTAGDISQLQTAVPDRGVGRTVKELSDNDSQHPPLYYVLTRLVMYVVPNTVVASRLVAAIAGILLIPATYWLTKLLFSQTLPATVSAAVVAVSPFQYLYAQEAREYSLWALTLIVACAVFVKALKDNRMGSWMLYAGAIALSLYSCVLTFLIMASHSLYMLWLVLAKQANTQLLHKRWPILRNFAVSSLGGLLLFVPWLSAISRSHAEKVSWTAVPLPFKSLAMTWVGNFSRLFFDVNFDNTDPLLYSVIPVLFFLALTLYALIWSMRNMPRPALVFIALLGGVTLLTFVGPDLIMGGRRSAVSRYLIPTYLSLQLAIAYFCSQKLFTPNTRTFGKSVTAVLLISGIVSCSVSLPADTWWHKKNSHHNPEVARIINKTSDSLLVSSSNNANLGELMSLSHSLKPEQPVLAFIEPTVPSIPNTAKTLFLFNVSKQARETLEQNYTVTTVFPEGRLWKMEPKS
ncbi:MAG: glycosyltransferase family 39 protein [Cyanobacteria bacterium J06576_12]